MVRHASVSSSFSKSLLILLLGPLSSFIIASTALWIAYSFNLHGAIKLFTLFFLISSIIDLGNLSPKETGIILDDGKIIYNDGYQIAKLFKSRTDFSHWQKGLRLFNQGKYNEALNNFRKIRYEHFNQDQFVFAISGFILAHDYSKAKIFYRLFVEFPYFERLNSTAYFYIGLIESWEGSYETSLTYYNKSIELNASNLESLCNRGFTYNLLEKYNEAIADFNEVISIDPHYSYAFANRAFSLLKLKSYDEALNDIEVALSINPNDSYAYRNLGVYYLDNADRINALKNFEIARQINVETYMIDEYIGMAKNY